MTVFSVFGMTLYVYAYCGIELNKSKQLEDWLVCFGEIVVADFESLISRKTRLMYFTRLCITYVASFSRFSFPELFYIYVFEMIIF